MAIMKKASQKEDAVSPVIGVMLMLVVTIVIAAVVAAFASGLGTDMDSTPAVVLDATVYTDGNVKLTSLSGENLVLSSTSVKVQKEDGTVIGSARPVISGDNPSKFLSPGTTAFADVLTAADATITEGTYVTVLILYNDKNIILNEDILVKKAVTSA